MKKVKTIIMAAILAAALVFSASFAQKEQKAENQTPVWEKLIASSDERERAAGRKIVMDQYNNTMGYLIALANRPVKLNPEADVYEPQRSMAIELLGKIRAKEAVNCIISWLVPRPGIMIESPKVRFFNAAGLALIEIGLPSVPPVAELLKNESNPYIQDEYLKIILAIKGRQETEMLLENMLTKEKDQIKIENIKAAQALLKDPKRQGVFNSAAKYAIRD
jgi:hypothetical protein